MNPRLECLKLLTHFDPDLNARNRNTMWTALHWCALWGDSDSAELLLKRGAFAFLPSKDGVFPIDLAGFKGHDHTVSVLIHNILDELDRIQSNNLSDDDLHKWAAWVPYMRSGRAISSAIFAASMLTDTEGDLPSKRAKWARKM